jgi:PadR family transcriptional regulator PadR
MSTNMAAPDRHALVQGTLDMLILRTLQLGPAHGHGIATLIEQHSGGRLRIDHGSLYPALQRLQQEGHIVSEWGTSDNNRRAKYYRLTAAGRRHLHAEASRWADLVATIGRVMNPADVTE